MDTILWTIQALLAVLFFITGFMKVGQPKEALKENLGPWVDGFSLIQVKTIGILEMIAAAGMLLPMWLRILPILTPLAALGLAATMIGAMMTHLKLKENKPALSNLILFVLCAFVAAGRLWIVPVV
jgi:uncharacterized membrane protein YphA (DoxX/SURF4 family)